MLGMLLSALSGAAGQAGLSGLAAGLSAAGTAIGGSGVPGLPGATPGAPSPTSSMPFGMNIADIIKPKSESLGSQQQAPMIAPAPQAPAVNTRGVDPSALLSIINSRNGLGT